MTTLSGDMLRGETKKTITTTMLWIMVGIVAIFILWYVVPKVWEYFSPTQEEIPVEVKVPTWQDTLPEAPMKFNFTIPVVAPPPVVELTNPSTKQRSKK